MPCILKHVLLKKKNKYADTVSLWAALTGRRLVSKVEHVCISRSTLGSSAVSTFLKRCSCHLTPPHDFLCSLPACLLADNASGHFVPHCNTLPVNFQRNARLTLWKLQTLLVSHYRRWTSRTGPPQKCLLSEAQTAHTSTNKTTYWKSGTVERKENKTQVLKRIETSQFLGYSWKH